MSMWRPISSYSPAMARRLTTSRFSASVQLDLVDVRQLVALGVDRQKYGFRSSAQFGVLIGETVRQGVTTGHSGLSA